MSIGGVRKPFQNLMLCKASIIIYSLFFSPKCLTRDEVAMGFIRVANEAMCRPIREISESRGHQLSSHVLSCFGGAGAQHACAIARSLNMGKVFIHRFSGILSAFGMGLADIGLFGRS